MYMAAHKKLTLTLSKPVRDRSRAMMMPDRSSLHNTMSPVSMARLVPPDIAKPTLARANTGESLQTLDRLSGFGATHVSQTLRHRTALAVGPREDMLASWVALRA